MDLFTSDELQKIKNTFAGHALGGDVNIASVKVEIGPRSGVAPFKHRAKVAVLCEGGLIEKPENLEVVQVARDAFSDKFRSLQISVMTSPRFFNWKDGGLVL